jgi:NAD(P)-dependent dehydrogenase (short-subunit alcohol dehydrogenase family)
MTYRAQPADGVAWVTGASSGIGRAVALELARRGFVVHATARRAEALHALAQEASGLTGRILAAPGDVTDRAAMAGLVAGIEAEGPIALAVLNAGGSYPDTRGDFGGEGFARTFALNVQGVANTVNPVFNAMRGRKRGQIAIVGSLAGYGGLPNTGGYAPSKAAVISLAADLKFRGDPHGVTVQIVNPGFVRTELTQDVGNPMPFVMEADEAARRLCDGLRRGGFEIRFPRRLAWIARAMNLLPYPLYFGLFKLGRGRG